MRYEVNVMFGAIDRGHQLIVYRSHFKQWIRQEDFHQFVFNVGFDIRERSTCQRLYQLFQMCGDFWP